MNPSGACMSASHPSCALANDSQVGPGADGRGRTAGTPQGGAPRSGAVDVHGLHTPTSVRRRRRGSHGFRDEPALSGSRAAAGLDREGGAARLRPRPFLDHQYCGLGQRDALSRRDEPQCLGGFGGAHAAACHEHPLRLMERAACLEPFGQAGSSNARLCGGRRDLPSGLHLIATSGEAVVEGRSAVTSRVVAVARCQEAVRGPGSRSSLTRRAWRSRWLALTSRASAARSRRAATSSRRPCGAPRPGADNCAGSVRGPRDGNGPTREAMRSCADAAAARRRTTDSRRCEDRASPPSGRASYRSARAVALRARSAALATAAQCSMRRVRCSCGSSGSILVGSTVMTFPCQG